LAVIALLRVRVLHRNRLGLGLLLLHLVLLLLMLSHGRRLLLWAALLLVLHLLLLLLELEVLGQVDERLAHLLPHGLYLLLVHAGHLVLEGHAHAALLLRKHLRLLLLAHKGLLLRVSVLLQHGGVHYAVVSRGQRGDDGQLTHAGVLLLLLREHVRLLGLEVRQRVGVRPHAWLHAHHGPCLADGAVGP
jgi:hypothetical protein